MGARVLTWLTDKNGAAFRARAYAPEDRRALEAMYQDFEPRRAAQGLPPADSTRTRQWLARVLASGLHFVAEQDGRIVGHAMLVPIDEQEGLELANFVHQSARGRGIGTALNQMAVEAARANGCARLWLSVEPSNRAALRSYEKVGFRMLPGSWWAPEVEMAIDLAPEPA